MADIFDYISWRGDLTFEQDGFNELDALVLSRLSYLPFDGAVSSCLFDEITLEQAAMRVFATDDYEKNLLWKGRRPFESNGREQEIRQNSCFGVCKRG